MNHNLKSLLFCLILTNVSKNFTSAVAAESSQLLTIGKQYVFPEASSTRNPFAKGILDIGIITEEKLVGLHSATEEKDKKITEAFAEKKSAMTPLMDYMHFFIQGAQESCIVKKALHENKELCLEKLGKIIAKQEEFLEPIVKEHVAMIVALHKLYEGLESAPK